MIKILIVNTVPTDKNGITNVIFNYLMATDRGACRMDLCSLNKPDSLYVNIVEERGGNIYSLQRNYRHLLSYWNGLRKLIVDNRYDIIHVHGNSHTVVLELSVAWAARCVVGVVHAHNTTCKYVVMHKLLTPIFNALCKYRLACGEAAGRFMFGNKPFKVMNNGVDTAQFGFDKEKRDKIRQELGLDGCKVLGHVGYFTKVKNQKFIVDILKELLDKDASYRLLLIGDGPMKKEVEVQSMQLRIRDKIFFTGNINNVHEYLNAIDVIVMPSLFEGLPLTLIEQQANGLPCVVADTITREADKTGLLTFIPLSAPVMKWAEAVKGINRADRAERSKDAIKSITEAGYNIHEQADKLVNFYQSTLK